MACKTLTIWTGPAGKPCAEIGRQFINKECRAVVNADQVSASDGWRARANAYLAVTQPGVSGWCLSEVLATLRHTGGGQLLWNEAREAGFFEQVSA